MGLASMSLIFPHREKKATYQLLDQCISALDTLWTMGHVEMRFRLSQFGAVPEMLH